MQVHALPSWTIRVVPAATPPRRAGCGLCRLNVAVALDRVVSAVLAPAAADHCRAVAKQVERGAQTRREEQEAAVGAGKRNAAIQAMPGDAALGVGTRIGVELRVVLRRIEHGQPEGR